MKKQVRRTLGALFMVAAILVAMIPTRSIQGGEVQAANSCNGTDVKEYYIIKSGTATTKTPLSQIPFVDPATTVYITGDMKFQFAYVNAIGIDQPGDTNKFAVILGYDPSGAVDSSGSLVIPEYVQSYKKLSDAEGYCLANVSGDFLFYRSIDRYEFQVEVKSGTTNPIEDGPGAPYFDKYSAGSQTLYGILQGYVPEDKRDNPGYYELVKPNRIGLFRVDEKTIREVDDSGAETGDVIYTYVVENTMYYPCKADNSDIWKAIDKGSLFYRDETVSDSDDGRFKQCTDASRQYVDNIAVRYIGNQFSYYDTTSKTYKVSPDDIDDLHPSNGVFADTKGGNIVNLSIPSTMEGIGDYAFYRCTALSGITFSNGLVAIGNHAFDGCRSLSSVGMPESPRITTLGAYAFKNCASLKNIYIPHSISMLCDGVFENCTGLTVMDLSGDINSNPTAEKSQLEYIGNHIFYGCSNLTTVILPSKLGEGYTSDVDLSNPANSGAHALNINMFEDCPNLEKITVVSPNVYFVSDDHTECGFDVEGSTSFHSQLVSDKFYFESIDPAAAKPPKDNIGALHYMCQNMSAGYEFTYKYFGKELYEKTVTEQNADASGLMYDASGNPVPGGKAIYQVNDTNTLCGFDTIETSSLKVGSLSFPEAFGPYHIESLPDGRFQDTCSLCKVTLPSSINRIGARAFKGCHNLEFVVFENDQVQIGDEAFKTQETTTHSCGASGAPASDASGYPKTKLYFVTTISADCTPFAYAMSAGGKYNHPSQKEAWPILFSGFPQLLEISYNPEKNCAELVNFPTEGSLSTYAAATNKYLNAEEKAAISHYLTERNTKSRDEIAVSGTTYDKQLVEVCRELFIPKGVESIQDGLFAANTVGFPMAVNTTGLTAIDVEYVKDASGDPVLDSNGRVQITAAGSDFAGCSTLTALTLSGENNLEIPDYGFYNCDGMTYVYSTQPVDNIGEEAFADCGALGNVEMYGVKSIENHAFANDDSLTGVRFDSALSSLGVAPFRVNMYNRSSGVTYPTHSSSLSNVDFQDNSYFKTENGIIYSLDNSGAKNALIEFLPGRTAGTIQPGETKGIKGVSEEAFADTAVNVVNLENASFTNLPSLAFEDTSQLVTVTLPQTCSRIDSMAFKGSAIKNLTVMNNDLYWQNGGLDLITTTMTDPNDDTSDHGGVSESANSRLTVYAPAETDANGNVTDKSRAYELFEGHKYLVQAFTPIKHFYISYYDYKDENATKATLEFTDEYVEGDQVILRDPIMDPDNKHSNAGFAFEYYYNMYDTEETYDYRSSFNITEDITLVAKYKGLNESYTAAFYDTDPDTGATGAVLVDNVPVLTSVESGVTKYYINPNLISGLMPTAKTGYTFQTWTRIDPRDGILFTIDQVEEKDGVIKFYAKYTSGNGGNGGNGGGTVGPGQLKVTYYLPDGSLYQTWGVDPGNKAFDIVVPGYSRTEWKWSPDVNETVINSDTKFVLVPIDGTDPTSSDKYTATYYYTDGVTVYQTLSIEKGGTPPDLMMPSGYKQCKWSPSPSSVTMDKNMRFTMVNNPDYNGADDYNGPYYTLTVVGGSGSGSYKPGAQVVIVANEAKTGTVFSSWTISPSTAPIASKALSATVVTMPGENVTVTANFVAKTAGNGNNGAGGNGSGGNNGGGNTNYWPSTGNVPRSSGTTVVIDKNGLSNTGVVSATVNGSTDNFTIKITESQTANKLVLDALLKKYGTLDNIIYFPFDISLYDAAGTTQITDTSGLTITITIPLPDSMVGYAANNKVAVITNNEIDPLNARFTTINGVPCVTFTCTHFSPYVIYVNTVEMTAGSDGSGAGNGLDNTPKTADFIHPKWFISIALFAISIVLFLMKDKKIAKPVKANTGNNAPGRRQ